MEREKNCDICKYGRVIYSRRNDPDYPEVTGGASVCVYDDYEAVLMCDGSWAKWCDKYEEVPSDE